MAVVGPQYGYGLALGPRVICHIESHLIEDVLHRQRVAAELRLAEADQGIFQNFGSAGTPAGVGDVVLWPHLPRDSHELAVGDVKNTALAGQSLPLRQM